jgi:lipopolysaccharide/colanic/teichoic acid biosynthesis glycosyltransferase
MKKHIKIAPYHESLSKNILNYAMSIPALMILMLITLILGPIIKLSSPGPIFFIQKRRGKNGRDFNIIKFRTMREGAEKERGNKTLESQNISDGPVFKISYDPRLTKVGTILWKSGLDELPQVINVLKGEMSFVGPRPFPLYEADKLTKKDRMRERVLPGITSSWVISGAHRLKFKKWMELDEKYVENGNLKTDIKILLSTLKLMTYLGFRKLLNISGL